MKKISAVFAALLLSSAMVVSASADKYMDVNNTNVEIFLNPDGSADITETWDCYYGGGEAITRYSRSYIDNDEYTLTNFAVSFDGVPMTMLDAKDDDRPIGCAAVYRDGNEVTVDIYQDSTNESHVAEISYTVENAVIIGTDAAEFRWNVTSENEASMVEHLEGFVELPEAIDEEEYKIWAHGPSNGEFVKESGSRAVFTCDDIPTYKAVAVRLLMPKEIFPDAERFDDSVSIQSVLDDESAAVEYENEMKSFDSAGMVMAKLGAFLIFICTTIAFIIRKAVIKPKLMKSKRFAVPEEPFAENNVEVPDELTTAAFAELSGFYDNLGVDFRNIFSSAMLRLVSVGAITVKKENGESVIAVHEHTADVCEYEQVALDMINAAIAHGCGRTSDSITVGMFGKYLRDNPDDAYNMRSRFNDLIRTSFDGYHLTGEQIKFPPFTLPKFAKYIILAAAAGITIALAHGDFDYFIFPLIGEVLIYIGICGIIKSVKMDVTLLNEQGERLYAKCMKFKKFITGCTSSNDIPIENFGVWTEYLIYASAIGQAKRISKLLKNIDPKQIPDYDSDTDYYDMWLNGYMYSMFDAMSGSVNYVSDPSISSYDGGDGGGFSDGGSFDSGSSGSSFD